jgi:hypothetical protein
MPQSYQANDFQTLNSHFKEIYADNIVDLIPESVKLYNSIDFISADKQNGQDYIQPVSLGLEHGFSYGGSDGTAFALQDAVQSTHKRAQIRGHEMVLRSFLSVGAASRSQNSKGAFVQETKFIVENMLKSFVRRLEVQLMYGQVGLGVVESIDVAGTTIKVEDHEWAAGIWSGTERMPIEIFAPALASSKGSAAIVSYNFDTKELVIDTDLSATVAAGDVIRYKGSAVVGTEREFAGLHKIISNTSTLFNIDASAYALWKGNVVEVGTDFAGNEARISFEKIEKGIARSMEKGLDEDVELLLNPNNWTDLLTEQVAKRQFDSSYSSDKMKNGAKELEFVIMGSSVKVKSSIYAKEGYAYMYVPKDFMRIGSSDITFERPGLGGKFLKLMEGFNGYEMRAYTDQALFTCCPGKTVLFTFIKPQAA